MEVSKSIALGCMRIGSMSVDDAEKLIKSAISQGINFFDHADIYGARKCEKIFGEVLARNPEMRNNIIIQTKCGICKGYYDSSKKHIIESVEESLRLLQTDYIDILLLHRPDALIDYSEVSEAFEELYRSGKVREFGVSNMTVWQMQLFAKYVKQPIKYNQMQYSVVHSLLTDSAMFVNMRDNEGIDRSSGVLEYCMLKDIKVQAWSVLLASWVDGTYIDNPKYSELNNQLAEIANKYGVSKNTIAVAWVLRHPANILAITGTTSITHLTEMAQARKIELTREEWYGLYLSAGHYLP